MISRLICSVTSGLPKLTSQQLILKLSRGFAVSNKSNQKEKSTDFLPPGLRTAVEEQKESLKITSDDITLTLYQINPIFKNAFFMLKWQLIFAMLGFAAFLLKEIFELLDKTDEFEERNVEFILKNCKAAGVDPTKEFPTVGSRQAIKNLLRKEYEKYKEISESGSPTFTKQNSEIPSIVRRRYKRSEELRQKAWIFAALLSCVELALIFALRKFTQIRKTFIRGIYYNPSQNRMDIAVYTSLFRKTVTNISPGALRYTESLGKGNIIDKKLYITKGEEGSALRGYEYLAYPSNTRWTAQEVFDCWLNSK